MNNCLIDVRELSQRLSVARGTLYNWVGQGKLPYRKIGRCVRFDWNEIAELFPCRSTMKSASKG